MTMDRAKQQQHTLRVRLVSLFIEGQIARRYHRASRRIIFLDYDGTLVPFASVPEAALPDERVLARLRHLAADPLNTVVIISGRKREFLDRWFGDLPLHLVAEHGAFVRRPLGRWTGDVEADPGWKQRVLPTLHRHADRCTGAFIEEKAASLVWHYRNADPDTSRLRSQELKDELRELLSHDRAFQVMEGHKVIEVKRSGYDKGSVAARLVSSAPYDFILAIGDDKTDEDIFRILPPQAVTLKIGISPSLARYNLKDQAQVAHLMDRLLGD